jgi:hypothetical protein
VRAVSNQELLENKGLVTTQNGSGAETFTDETTRKAVDATSVPSKRCDSRGSEYFTKNPDFAPRSSRAGRKSRGQPPKLDATRKKFVASMVSLGFSLRQIARNLQIDHSTISRAAQRDREFAAALARAKEESSMHPQLGFRGWRAALDVIQRIETTRRR